MSQRLGQVGNRTRVLEDSVNTTMQVELLRCRSCEAAYKKLQLWILLIVSSCSALLSAFIVWKSVDAIEDGISRLLPVADFFCSRFLSSEDVA